MTYYLSEESQPKKRTKKIIKRFVVSIVFHEDSNEPYRCGWEEGIRSAIREQFPFAKQVMVKAHLT